MRHNRGCKGTGLPFPLNFEGEGAFLSHRTHFLIKGKILPCANRDGLQHTSKNGILKAGIPQHPRERPISRNLWLDVSERLTSYPARQQDRHR